MGFQFSIIFKSFFDVKLFLRNSENTYYIQKLKKLFHSSFSEIVHFLIRRKFPVGKIILRKTFTKLQMLVISPFLMDFGDPFSSSDDESNRFFFDFLLTLMGESIESSSCLFASFKGEL